MAEVGPYDILALQERQPVYHQGGLRGEGAAILRQMFDTFESFVE
jgi:hypothetical protein